MNVTVDVQFYWNSFLFILFYWKKKKYGFPSIYINFVILVIFFHLLECDGMKVNVTMFFGLR
jgi:hypothetical protein